MKKRERGIFMDVKTGEGEKNNLFLVSPVTSICQIGVFLLFWSAHYYRLINCRQNTMRMDHSRTSEELLRRKCEERRFFHTHCAYFFSKSLRLIHPVPGYMTHLA